MEGRNGIEKERIYAYFGITRQGYNSLIKRMIEEECALKEIEKKVVYYRSKKDSRAGSRSLYYNLEIKSQFGIGVTKFEQLLSANGLVLKPLDIRVITTKSVFNSKNYDNLLNGKFLRSYNEVIVGDITYINFGGKRYYLFCLTDVYSARVVGTCLSDRMRKEEAIQALQEAIKLRKEGLKGCIHHTDGGGQYFSKAYLDLVQSVGLQVSVAKNCLENGYAEQRNGFVKHHLLPMISKDINLKELQLQMKEKLNIYNLERKQEKLGWKSPVNYEKYVDCLIESKRPIKQLYNFSQ